ncbi:MAG: hypothetical protein FK734_09055 [Asgard group archaeon]|nr:hypothetical protein [Asgard group archaeon]
MKIVHQTYYNPQAITEVNPQEILIQGFSRINSMIKYLKEMNSDILEKYILELEKLFTQEIKDYRIDEQIINLDNLTQDFIFLNEYPNLIKLIFSSSCKRLQLTNDFQNKQEKWKVSLLNEMGTRFHISFLRVKALVNILGREEGISLWKKFVEKVTIDRIQNLKKEIFKPINEKFSDEELDNWGKIGSQDFSVVIYDENKAYMKTNRCVVHEAFKEFNDMELAYLSYCYTGSVEDKYNNRIWRRKTPITLFQNNSFCIEFFYNHNIYPKAEPPTITEAAKISENDLHNSNL